MLDDEYSDESVVSVADLAIGTSAPVWIITMVQCGGVSKEWVTGGLIDSNKVYRP